MNFQVLCIDNNNFHQEQLYDITKTKTIDEVKSTIQPLIKTIVTNKEFLLKDVYETLDIVHDSITFYLKTTTIYEDAEYLFQMISVSDDDIYDGKFFNIDKYKFNFLGKLLINTDDNVNGKFIIFGYKINEDNTYDFCDMTSDMFCKLIYKNLFKEGAILLIFELNE